MCCDAGAEAVLKIAAHTKYLSQSTDQVPGAPARFVVHRMYFLAWQGPRGSSSSLPISRSEWTFGGP